MKKWPIPVFLGLFLLISLISGCGGGSSGNGSTPSPTPTNGGGNPTPTPTPGTSDSIKGTWFSNAPVNPQVTLKIGDCVNIIEPNQGGPGIDGYYYKGEIICSVLAGGKTEITGAGTINNSLNYILIWSYQLSGTTKIIWNVMANADNNNGHTVQLMLAGLAGSNELNGGILIKERYDEALYESDSAKFTKQ